MADRRLIDANALRDRIAALLKPNPDDSHGEPYINHGIEAALRVIDFALDAPCRFRPTHYGQWCELHNSPVSDDYPMVGDRCGGYRYVADQALIDAAPTAPLDAARLRAIIWQRFEDQGYPLTELQIITIALAVDDIMADLGVPMTDTVGGNT